MITQDVFAVHVFEASCAAPAVLRLVMTAFEPFEVVVGPGEVFFCRTSNRFQLDGAVNIRNSIVFCLFSYPTREWLVASLIWRD